jgi:excisionase family DNA binding protein
MTLQQVADYLNCHYTTILRLLAKRAIPGFRLGGGWRFWRSDVDKWIESRTFRASETEPEPTKQKGRKPKPRPSPQRAKGT